MVVYLGVSINIHHLKNYQDIKYKDLWTESGPEFSILVGIGSTKSRQKYHMPSSTSSPLYSAVM